MNGRSVLDPQWNPGTAWAKSLPLALLIPVAIWALMMVGAVVVDRSELWGAFAFLFIYLFYAVPIHLIMYALVGLPIFIYGGRENGRWLWRWPGALALGTAAGIVPSMAVAALIYGRDIFLPEALTWVIVLGLYGLITGFAACRQRPPDDWAP